MISKITSFFLITATLTIPLVSCQSQTNENNQNTNRNNKQIIYSTENKKPSTLPNGNNNALDQGQTDDHSTSGETQSIPWEANENFKSAQTKNNSAVLLAAYRTVLKDPLPGEENNVHLAAKMLTGKVVMPGEIFSQNQQIGPYTLERGFEKGPTYIGSQVKTTIGGGVCKIASTLYNVAILSNLPVVERHNHDMPVPYVPYGQDATVSYGLWDLKFKNNTDSPIMIWAEGIDNVLYIGFYGKAKPPKVKWNHEVLKSIPAPKKYKINKSLPAGAEKIELQGMDGAVVKSWLSIENQDGSKAIKQMGTSSYSPLPFIIEKGPEK
ncbi:MAG: VanW family protein [Bacillota bacterium]|nr:VanW family protein [Bacillota bacterium]